jgi:3',5'-cyclic-AMP phosphodiesterase
MLLAQISDLHIKKPGGLAYRRVDTAKYLERCITSLNALLPRPAAVIMTGDLVDQGDPEQYEHLKTLLAKLEIPYYLLVGNHDDRQALRDAFKDKPELHADRDFVQYTADIGALRLIALDSMVPGQSAGLLCDARLQWLDQQLQASKDKPVIVALHHPPFVSGIGHMDALRLDPASAAKLETLTKRYANIERIICGHVHRPMFVRFGGTIASAVPAPAHQVALDLRDDAPSAFVMEPPAFALHRYDSVDGLITHHGYVEQADGPYPFYEPEGKLID